MSAPALVVLPAPVPPAPPILLRHVVVEQFTTVSGASHARATGGGRVTAQSDGVVVSGKGVNSGPDDARAGQRVVPGPTVGAGDDRGHEEAQQGRAHDDLEGEGARADLPHLQTEQSVADG